MPVVSFLTYTYKIPLYNILSVQVNKKSGENNIIIWYESLKSNNRSCKAYYHSYNFSHSLSAFRYNLLCRLLRPIRPCKFHCRYVIVISYAGQGSFTTQNTRHIYMFWFIFPFLVHLYEQHFN